MSVRLPWYALAGFLIGCSLPADTNYYLFILGGVIFFITWGSEGIEEESTCNCDEEEDEVV